MLIIWLKMNMLIIGKKLRNGMPIMVKRMRIGQTDVGLVRNGMKTDIWIENM